MKITSFEPQIITNNPEQVEEVFKALGFEKKHTKSDFTDRKITGVVMEDKDGHRVDYSVPEIEVPQDMTVIRINVRDFDEAYKLLLSFGFKNFYGENELSAASSKSAVMFSPSGFAINLAEHFRKDD